MARLLVEIDEDLKKELKVKLLREGITLKEWLTRSARDYVVDPVAPRQRAHPQAGPAVIPPRSRHDDYLD